MKMNQVTYSKNGQSPKTQLFVGDSSAASKVNKVELKTNNIHGILNVAFDRDDTPFLIKDWLLEFEKVGLYDTGPNPKPNQLNNSESMLAAISILDQMFVRLPQNSNILVHCCSGGSRSVTVAALWMAQRLPIEPVPGETRFMTALNAVRNARGLGMGAENIPYDPLNPNYGNPDSDDKMWPSGKPMAALFYLAQAIDECVPDFLSNNDNLLTNSFLSDNNFKKINGMIKNLFKDPNIISAGGVYGGDVWVRDLNTFAEAFLDQCNEPKIRQHKIRKAIINFFKGQGTNYNSDDELSEYAKGSIADLYNDKNNNISYKKISVETDQETSLIQLVWTYIHKTGDIDLLQEKITVNGSNGKTVLTVFERMEEALNFLFRDRWADEFGLIFGGVTVDWGDISPDSGKNGIGANLRPGISHIASDIYDNAMLVIALEKFISFLEFGSSKQLQWSEKLNELRKNIMLRLWDNSKMKFIPHLYPKEDYPKNNDKKYLKGSPWKLDEKIPFDESNIFFHGGTGIAILAGLLNQEQIACCFNKMKENARKADDPNNPGVTTIGLTLYPPYPQNVWKSSYTKKRIGEKTYFYQNGGDWTWFGARIALGLIQNGFIKEAYEETKKMVKRSIQKKGFFEWWNPGIQDGGSGEHTGTGNFRGSAGVLYVTIKALHEWAIKNK